MRFIIILFIVFFISSCSSKKDIIYFQDFDQIEKVDTKYSTYKLKTDDVLKIDISAENFAAVQIFDKLGPSNSNNNTDSYLYNGYQIDSNGFIDFPTLGKIKAEGLTTTEIKDLIFKMLVDDDFLVNPFVDVKLINAYFTIIGEVNSPGRYTFLEKFFIWFSVYIIYNQIRVVNFVSLFLQKLNYCTFSCCNTPC